uniref:Histone deacetylase domain-containing protein n=1 Tax=Oryza glumipatula TaxID=40148 RepID=A0A0D9ZVI6_9ORYZ
MSSQFGGPFSYCLSPTSGGAGFLALGAPNSSNTAAGFSFTPMRRIPSVPTFYVVTLTGISVGGAPLAIPPSAFSSGMVIDSGTVITGLLATAYAAVTAASDAAATSDLLRNLTPESYVNDTALRQKAEDDHGIGLLGGDDDLLAFDRLWKYCCGYAGVSLAAARALVDGASEITINWSGGMHHASACKASGFCYINDTLIAINELLPYPCRPGRHCAAAELPESSVPPCIAAPCAGMPCILVVGAIELEA